MTVPKKTRPDTAKVFMSGRSQAIRLPKQYRFASTEVAIRKVGDNLVLSPLYEGWDDYLANAPRVSDDFIEVMAAREEPSLEKRESFD